MILMTIVILLLTAVAAAQPQGIHEPGTGLSSPEVKQNDQADGQPGANGIHEPGTGIADPETKETRVPGQGQAASDNEEESTTSTPGFEAMLALTGIAGAVLLTQRSQRG